MGRRRNYTPYRRPYRRTHNQVWIPANIDANLASANVQDDSTYFLGEFPLGFLNELEGTLERQRGTIRIRTNRTASQVNGIVFAVVAPAEFTQSVTPGTLMPNFPNPVESDGSDDFPMVMDGCIPVAASIFELEIDSKARRKVDRDKRLIYAFHIYSTVGNNFPDIRFQGLVRSLFRLKV